VITLPPLSVGAVQEIVADVAVFEVNEMFVTGPALTAGINEVKAVAADDPSGLTALIRT
jgi:hypothetical protein